MVCARCPNELYMNYGMTFGWALNCCWVIVGWMFLKLIGLFVSIVETPIEMVVVIVQRTIIFFAPVMESN